LFYAFDLLCWTDATLRPLPLVDRKAQLERLVLADSRLLSVRHLEADGTRLFAAVCQNDSKTTWVKVLNPSYSQRE
jgi:ATP-dependent DNA ligase